MLRLQVSSDFLLSVPSCSLSSLSFRLFPALAKIHLLVLAHTYKLGLLDDPVAQFALGSPGTGSPVHYHNAAWNGLFYGLKKWYLLPPSEKLISSVPVKEWVDTHVPALESTVRVASCVQQPGDIIFVPNNWAHAVLNLKSSVAIAWEGKHLLMMYAMMAASAMSMQAYGTNASPDDIKMRVSKIMFPAAKSSSKKNHPPLKWHS